jgi:hypothetical protein
MSTHAIKFGKGAARPPQKDTPAPAPSWWLDAANFYDISRDRFAQRLPEADIVQPGYDGRES